MSDRIHSLTVVLDSNYRADDIQAMCDAIRMLRGVVSVGKNVADSMSFVAMERARTSIGEKLLAILYPEDKP